MDVGTRRFGATAEKRRWSQVCSQWQGSSIQGFIVNSKPDKKQLSEGFWMYSVELSTPWIVSEVPNAEKTLVQTFNI